MLGSGPGYEDVAIQSPASSHPPPGNSPISVDLGVLAAAQGMAEQLQAAREEAAAKDYFLSVLSHELRTPLTPALMLAANLAENVALPMEARLDAAKIRHSIEMQARLLDDLLDLTRIGHGKLRMEMHPVDMHQVIHEALRVCDSQAGAPVCLDLLAAQSIVHGDAQRLAQVMWNLLGNARKFTPASGRITVRTSNRKRPGSSGGAAMIVEVSDTGPGIDPALLERIFIPFVQGENGQQCKGLGLGLAITKSIVEGHDGTISAFSRGVGTGATFVLELPLALILPGGMPNVPPHEPLPAIKPLRILLVEDHGATLDVLAKLLRSLGHEVHTASTVQAALTRASQCSPELLISDLGLPDASGHDLMRQLRTRSHLKGIALSGYGMESDMRKSREAGFDEHLIKPVDLPRLEEAIQRIVQDWV